MQFTDSNPENVHKTVTKVFREVKEAIQNSLFTKMSGVDKCNVIKERNEHFYGKTFVKSWIWIVVWKLKTFSSLRNVEKRELLSNTFSQKFRENNVTKEAS